MISSIPSFLALACALLSHLDHVHAQYPANLVGTWTTKSKAVYTGPGFYNPVEDRIIEPSHAGISYSFTSDGFYEESYYRAISNPSTPKCPSSLLQWQHGTYSLPGNGSLILQPIGVDGRQVLSSPCGYDHSIYTRYEQPELFKSYEILTDPYHNVQRLNLFRFDGSPMQPMYLAYNPPQMLPTMTLNPTQAAATGGGTQATGKAKRGLDGEGAAEGLAQRMLKDGSAGEKLRGWSNKILLPSVEGINPDKWWWAGVGFIALGTVMYMMPTST